MSDSGRTARQSWTPWLIAVIAGVVFVVLIIVYYVPLDHARADSGADQFSSSEKAAMTAASVEASNLLTFSRAKFDADFTRAANGTTGALKKDFLSKKATTLSVITKGKFDLTARVTHQALVGPSGKGGKAYDVLISVNGYKSTTPDVPTQQNLIVTVTKVGSSWLASNLQSSAVS